ncbi:hypothetical protein GCM10009716_46530 [Streptomyces sodiiphilus]|uniref:Sugar kinase n=1 Tax=Streptomyces sodiiphilus TaxID=226217 RepID=A0ABP5B6W0_9ACTN
MIGGRAPGGKPEKADGEPVADGAASPAVSTAQRPPYRPRRRWLMALTVFLLIAIPAGYIAISGHQSRDSGQDKQRAASARGLVYEWPSRVQRRIYDIPIPDGSTYVAHYETNSWESSTMFVQFRTSPDQLATFLESLGSQRAALSEGTVTIRPEEADVVGWYFGDPSRSYAGTVVRRSPTAPEVAITVDLTKPERPRVHVVSTTTP